MLYLLYVHAKPYPTMVSVHSDEAEAREWSRCINHIGEKESFIVTMDADSFEDVVDMMALRLKKGSQ